MFKFLVVSVVLAVAHGAPGIGHGGYYGGYAGLPAATSYSSRVDVHTPVIKTYAAPALVATPIISKAYVSPAISYHSSPLVSSYGVGIGHGHSYGGLGHGLGHGYGLGQGYSLGHGLDGYGLGHSYGYGGYGHGIGYGHGW